ncbi:hypothetical protein DPMN_048092 [Dreissena polymorpha]|uniref:Uncharacterized protein n=1 Tax=Dreissena polymorpha TaxID=45954 RepID=A0A9D4I2I8_DREPO|nr:hypothetical protein DPMN_048092 [Dreissena polymorpha]
MSKVITRSPEQDNFGTNLLTKFHEDRKINVSSRVLTRNIRACDRPTDRRTIQLLTKFCKDRMKSIRTRERTRKTDLQTDSAKTIYPLFLERGHKNAPTPGGHVFQPTGIIFVQDIIGMNLLTKFHEDWTINPYMEKCPAPWQPFFSAKVTIFELIQDIIGTNLLSKFHEDRKINVASRVLNSHVFQPTGIIFKLVQDIIEMNLLTKFHEDQKINMASRVLTRFYYSYIVEAASRSGGKKNAPSLGSHVFQANATIFELIQDIIETNLLTKFHKDWTTNVASRELTRKTASTPSSHVFQGT